MQHNFTTLFSGKFSVIECSIQHTCINQSEPAYDKRYFINQLAVSLTYGHHYDIEMDERSSSSIYPQKNDF